MKLHLDQSDQTIGYMLTPPKIIELLESWRIRENDGEEPSPGLEASPHQISALHSRLVAGGCPYVDFGIWRPHGEDFQRAMQFTAHVPLADGTIHVREIRGPDTCSGWQKQWRLYTFVMTLLQAASRTRLATYRDFIIALYERYPEFWWVIALADAKMRQHGLELVRRDCKKKHALGTCPDYKDDQPWDVAFREATKAKEFWDTEVIEKVTDLKNRLVSAAQVLDKGFGKIVMTDGTTINASHPSVPRASGVTPRARRSLSVSSGSSPPRKRQNPPAGNDKDAEGAFTANQAGLPICSAYSAGRCDDANCNLAHACRLCRAGSKRHRPQQCPKNPASAPSGRPASPRQSGRSRGGVKHQKPKGNR